MATHGAADGAPSGFDRLMEEASAYLASRAGKIDDKAVDKLGDLTDGLQDVAGNGGRLGDLGGRLLQGYSPAKAILGQTFSGLKDKVKDVGSGLLGGDKKSRKGGGKAIDIIESVDVGVPLRTAYDHWPQYENFSSFAKGVRSVSQSDDTTTDWKVKVGRPPAGGRPPSRSRYRTRGSSGPHRDPRDPPADASASTSSRLPSRGSSWSSSTTRPDSSRRPATCGGPRATPLPPSGPLCRDLHQPLPRPFPGSRSGRSTVQGAADGSRRRPLLSLL
ncbi:SRPBCC family protein [Streptomyces sp. SS]|uniref:SRPBCC family protein n=1 Tax=Streptomyces sp. SS TaxID=260742 RepID=UPI00030987B0